LVKKLTLILCFSSTPDVSLYDTTAFTTVAIGALWMIQCQINQLLLHLHYYLKCKALGPLLTCFGIVFSLGDPSTFPFES
jgi:hypothetical protein